jgi:ribosomal protein S8E
MSKRHQTQRRRSYGRREHEIRERRDRTWSSLDEVRELGEESFAGMDVAVRELGLPAYGSAYLGVD